MAHQQALLLSISAGLGRVQIDNGRNGQRIYLKSDDCLGCLKDLQRFLRRDDPETRDVFFKLGDLKLAENDLVPIITTFPDDKDLVFNALKVLTFLTMPVDPTSDHPSRQIRDMQQVKAAMLQPGAVASIVALLADPLSRHPRMTEDDAQVVQLVLTIVRNLLCIPDAIARRGQSGGDHLSRLHEALLGLFFQESVLELLLQAALHANERPFKAELSLLLDIFRELFREIDPEVLAATTPLAAAARPSSGQRDPTAAAQIDAQELRERLMLQLHPDQPRAATTSRVAGAARPSPPAAAAAAGGPLARSGSGGGATGSRVTTPTAGMSLMQAQLEEEQRHRAAKAAKHSRGGAQFVRRHAEHGGTVFVRNVAASELPALPATALTLSNVGRAGGAAVAATAQGLDGELHRNQLGAQLMWQLKEYAGEVLLGGYNVMMEAARRELEPGLGISRLDRNDFVAFLHLNRFFTAFLRCRQQAQPPAPATAAVDADGTGPAAAPAPADSPFVGVCATMGWETFHLMQTLWISQMDVPLKSGEKDWEIQHASMAALKEMLLLLHEAERSGSPDDRKAADRLQRRLLHDDLKESGLLPVLGRMIKMFSPKHQPRSHAADLIQGVDIVLRMYDRLTSVEAGGFLVRRRAGTGRRRKSVAEALAETEDPTGAAAAAGEGGATTSNAAGGTTSEAAGGTDGGTGEQDAPTPTSPGALEAAAAKGRAKDPMEELDDEGDEEDGEGGEGRRRTREVAYDLTHRLRQELVVPAVIHFYVGQMHSYASNAASTNAGICSLLWRVVSADQLNLEPMLYQLSCLRVFHAVLSDPMLRRPDKLPAFKPMLSLATRVVRGLFARLAPPTAAEAAAKKVQAAQEAGEVSARPPNQEEVEREDKILGAVSSMLFVDMMFWKAPFVAEEIKADYYMRVENVDYATDMRAADVTERHAQPMTAPGRRFADLGDDDDGDGDGGGDGGTGRPATDAADSVPTGRTAAATGGVGAMAGGAPRLVGMHDLAKERERLRKQHMQQQKANGPRPSALNADGLTKLRRVFEKHNSSKHNLDSIVREMGGGLTAEQVQKELRNMGLKFGQLTAAQIIMLRELYELHKRSDDFLLLITAGMSGGWTSKDVKRLLRKHGIHGAKAAKGGDDGEEDEDNSEDELYGFDDEQLRLVYAENLAAGVDGAVQAVSEAMGDVAPLAAVRRKLQRMGLIKTSKGRGKPGMVSPALLRELHGKHCGDPDMLNLLAALLPGGLSASQVQRLLRKHGLDNDDAGGKRKKAMEAQERAKLEELYLQHSGEPDYLDLIAAELPGEKTTVQVARLLRKAGLLPSNKRRKGDKPDDGGGKAKGGKGRKKEGEEEEAPGGVGGRVPEPSPRNALMYLKALQKASDGRWLSPEQAVAWIVGKVAAAEKLWALTELPHVDYALVMNGQEDEAFFMTEYSHEFLAAAGIRQDDNDYFKLPGNSDAAWRARVLRTVRQALEQLDSPEAEALLSEVPKLNDGKSRASEPSPAPSSRAAAQAAARNKAKGKRAAAPSVQPKGKRGRTASARVPRFTAAELALSEDSDSAEAPRGTSTGRAGAEDEGSASASGTSSSSSENERPGGSGRRGSAARRAGSEPRDEAGKSSSRRDSMRDSSSSGGTDSEDHDRHSGSESEDIGGNASDDGMPRFSSSSSSGDDDAGGSGEGGHGGNERLAAAAPKPTRTGEGIASARDKTRPLAEAAPGDAVRGSGGGRPPSSQAAAAAAARRNGRSGTAAPKQDSSRSAARRPASSGDSSSGQEDVADKEHDTAPHLPKRNSSADKARGGSGGGRPPTGRPVAAAAARPDAAAPDAARRSALEVLAARRAAKAGATAGAEALRPAGNQSVRPANVREVEAEDDLGAGKRRRLLAAGHAASGTAAGATASRGTGGKENAPASAGGAEDEDIELEDY